MQSNVFRKSLVSGVNPKVQLCTHLHADFAASDQQLKSVAHFVVRPKIPIGFCHFLTWIQNMAVVSCSIWKKSKSCYSAAPCPLIELVSLIGN